MAIPFQGYFFARWNRQWSNRWLPISLILGIGLGLSLGLFVVTRRWENRDQQEELNFASQHFIEAIRLATERFEMAHDFVRQDYYGSRQVSQREFSLCVESILTYVPSLKVLQWAPRVGGDQRASFVESVRREGLPDYRIVEPDSQGRLIAAKRRDVYFPILYAGTRSGFQARLGWDFEADPVLRSAIAECRDTDRFVASQCIDLSRIGLDSRMVQTFLPVYHDPEHTHTVAERRKNLRGVLVGLCQLDDLVDNAMSYASGPHGINVAVYDTTSPEDPTLLYYHRSRMFRQPRETKGRQNHWAGSQRSESMEASHALESGSFAAKPSLHPAGLHFVGSLKFGHRSWQLVCTPAAQFFAPDAGWRSWIVLAIGLVMTYLATTRAWAWMTRTEQIERLATERTLELRKKDDQLRQSQEAKTRALRAAHEETIERLVAASLCRDEETGTHIKRTGLLSEMLAREAGWSETAAKVLRLAAPMHDVGKIGIPDAILRKPDKLTPAEFEIMKTHTLIGARMLDGSISPILQMAHNIALAHHERWDGSGYPKGLAGTDIPEAARIVSIVDVYDALSHDRVYRSALPEDEVLEYLAQGSGTQFDPTLLAIFLVHHEAARQILQQNPDEPMVLADEFPSAAFVPSAEAFGSLVNSTTVGST
ncbi:MAG: CHASE domain-containing protein [Thermoguttaceae bacterium]